MKNDPQLSSNAAPELSSDLSQAEIRVAPNKGDKSQELSDTAFSFGVERKQSTSPSKDTIVARTMEAPDLVSLGHERDINNASRDREAQKLSSDPFQSLEMPKTIIDKFINFLNKLIQKLVAFLLIRRDSTTSKAPTLILPTERKKKRDKRTSREAP